MGMNNYSFTVTSRIAFASEQYHKLLNSFNRTKSGQLTEFISGYKARKLNQAYQIYCYYVFVSTGNKQNPPSIYNR
jgi:hypothetical protein